MPPDMTHQGSINGMFISPVDRNHLHEYSLGDYDQQMKQSPNQQQTQPPVPPVPNSDVADFNYSTDPSNDTNAILKLKESMQEEVKKFDKTPNNDDFNHYGSMG